MPTAWAAGYLQVAGELPEATHAEERLAQDQQRPALADDLERACDRLAVEAMGEIWVVHGSANVPVQQLNQSCGNVIEPLSSTTTK